jgi:cellulose synthase/poly-beta-1,6-N-acetylglucosamine synthase-like glycosyltransferase
VLTDADAFFEPDCLTELVKPFADTQIGGVQADLILQTENGNEVAHEEARYTYREMEIKQGEGRKGCIIGAFGACYALRRQLYQAVPDGFVVDDFYLFMRVLQQEKACVFAENARYRLLLSGDAALQFRRKRRIGKGNFQNLAVFAPMLFRFNRTAYCFWSHKVLRWLTPFLLATAWFSSLVLAYTGWFYGLTAILISLALVLALTDQFVCKPLGLRIRPLRFLRHFLWMNLALLLGLWDALSGPRQGYWNNRP